MREVLRGLIPRIGMMEIIQSQNQEIYRIPLKVEKLVGKYYELLIYTKDKVIIPRNCSIMVSVNGGEFKAAVVSITEWPDYKVLKLKYEAVAYWKLRDIIKYIIEQDTDTKITFDPSLTSREVSREVFIELTYNFDKTYGPPISEKTVF